MIPSCQVYLTMLMCGVRQLLSMWRCLPHTTLTTIWSLVSSLRKNRAWTSYVFFLSFCLWLVLLWFGIRAGHSAKLWMINNHTELCCAGLCRFWLMLVGNLAGLTVIWQQDEERFFGGRVQNIHKTNCKSVRRIFFSEFWQTPAILRGSDIGRDQIDWNFKGQLVSAKPDFSDAIWNDWPAKCGAWLC